MLKDNLIMLRNMHGYSQEEIAEKIGISRQAYAKWESGATIPDIEKCSCLAKVYGVTVDSLIKTETADGIGIIPPAPRGKKHLGLCYNQRARADCHSESRKGQVWTYRRAASDCIK